jgi:hypothetical protein
MPRRFEQCDGSGGCAVAYSSAYQAQIDSNSRFYTTGLAGRYVLHREPAARLDFEIRRDRGDILDSPVALETEDVDGLVLTFTDRPSTVAGTVRDPQGRAMTPPFLFSSRRQLDQPWA